MTASAVAVGCGTTCSTTTSPWCVARLGVAVAIAHGSCVHAGGLIAACRESRVGEDHVRAAPGAASERPPQAGNREAEGCTTPPSLRNTACDTHPTLVCHCRPLLQTQRPHEQGHPEAHVPAAQAAQVQVPTARRVMPLQRLTPSRLPRLKAATRHPRTRLVVLRRHPLLPRLPRSHRSHRPRRRVVPTLELRPNRAWTPPRRTRPLRLRLLVQRRRRKRRARARAVRSVGPLAAWQRLRTTTFSGGAGGGVGSIKLRLAHKSHVED